ncbi:zinc finger protein 699 isoform X2 [Nematostella vectensis]|nr:zinc finger protein 699 isoform X1 [Nematostella vectensis]XP_048585572.1 zinc finger protein 699 isoform X2 [Nematostella vectensis]
MDMNRHTPQLFQPVYTCECPYCTTSSTPVDTFHISPRLIRYQHEISVVNAEWETGHELAGWRCAISKDCLTKHGYVQTVMPLNQRRSSKLPSRTIPKLVKIKPNSKNTNQLHERQARSARNNTIEANFPTRRNQNVTREIADDAKQHVRVPVTARICTTVTPVVSAPVTFKNEIKDEIPYVVWNNGSPPVGDFKDGWRPQESTSPSKCDSSSSFLHFLKKKNISWGFDELGCNSTRNSSRGPQELLLEGHSHEQHGELKGSGETVFYSPRAHASDTPSKKPTKNLTMESSTFKESEKDVLMASLDIKDKKHVNTLVTSDIKPAVTGAFPATQSTGNTITKATCTCSFCGKSFGNPRALELHVRRHSGHRPYDCQFCSKSFFQPSERAVHMRTHTGARPYRCPYCLKLFRYSGDLKQHINIHTGQRPYQCESCSKAFTNHSTLRQHRRIHTGERPYKCEICDRTYRYHSSLKQHLATHTSMARKGGKETQVSHATHDSLARQDG